MGGKRHGVDVTEVVGLEEIVHPMRYESRSRSAKVSGRVTSPDWRVSWQHSKDGVAYMESCYADAEGVHDGYRIVRWDGTVVEDTKTVAQAHKDVETLKALLAQVRECPLCGVSASWTSDEAERAADGRALSAICRCHYYPSEQLPRAVAEAQKAGVDRTEMPIYRFVAGEATVVEMVLRRELGEWRVGGAVDMDVVRKAPAGATVRAERVWQAVPSQSSSKGGEKPAPCNTGARSIADGASRPSDDRLADLMKKFGK
jgi:hypothetical protein